MLGCEYSSTVSVFSGFDDYCASDCHSIADYIDDDVPLYNFQGVCSSSCDVEYYNYTDGSELYCDDSCVAMNDFFEFTEDTNFYYFTDGDSAFCKVGCAAADFTTYTDTDHYCADYCYEIGGYTGETLYNKQQTCQTTEDHVTYDDGDETYTDALCSIMFDYYSWG